MSARADRGGRSEVLWIAALIVVGALGATVLDDAPWCVPWALAAVLLAKVTARIAVPHHRAIRRRAGICLAAAGCIMALIVWGGSGVALSREARRQLRMRPAAAVTASVRGHTHRHLTTVRQPRDARRRQPALGRSPAAQLYGITQLGRWHWQRLIVGDSALLGGPLVLAGVSVGLVRRRQRPMRPGQPPVSAFSPSDQSGLRTAGRGR